MIMLHDFFDPCKPFVTYHPNLVTWHKWDGQPILVTKCDIKLDRFSPNLLVELWVANIGRDAVESYILKLIARPINIGCKSSNFIIIMRRVQSLKQPMVRATCFSFYINFTRANLCRVSIEQNYTACVSTPLQCDRAQINAPAILQETWHVHACIHVYLFSPASHSHIKRLCSCRRSQRLA